MNGGKSGGLEYNEINSNWDNEKEYEIERERLLYRLMTIEKRSESPGYFGSTYCKICDLGTPYGSRSYIGVEWPINIHHYIEFHGHKPTEEEIGAIESLFEELNEREQKRIRLNMKMMMARNQQKTKN